MNQNYWTLLSDNEQAKVKGGLGDPDEIVEIKQTPPPSSPGLGG